MNDMKKYTKIVFAKKTEYDLLADNASEQEAIIKRKMGNFLTKKQYAGVNYDFTGTIDSVILTIDEQYFDEEDIDDLILFLEESKKEIRRRVAKKLRKE